MDLNFEKYSDGLIPAIVQDAGTLKVLMLGYMNKESLELTHNTGKVTFFSRSKKRLWTKGESSGNFLLFKEIKTDCDKDALLIIAEPAGPVCHTGADTCFGEKNEKDILSSLETIIADRIKNPSGQSYVSSLSIKGMNKIAQKVGEEAVELVIESKDNDNEKFLNEAADLLFHYMILLQAKGFNLENVREILSARNQKK